MSPGNRMAGFTSGFRQSAPAVFGGRSKNFSQIQNFEAASSPVDPNPNVTSQEYTGGKLVELDPYQKAPGTPPSPAPPVSKPSFMEKLANKIPDPVKDMFVKPGQEGLTAGEAFAQLKVDPQFAGVKDEVLQELAKDMATKAVDSSLKLIPTSLAVGTAATLAGAFDPIEPTPLEDPYDKPSPSETRLAKYPGRYRSGVAAAPSAVTMQDTMVPSNSQKMYQKYLNQQQQPQFAAAGGEMGDFPRRTGYIGGSGTETSDDIPAMLSDGEFVMNARAVRGAGNGSRKEGVRKMYDIMRAFEGGAVA